MGSIQDMEDLSISNPSPVRLERTPFLHELVSLQNDSSVPAIDFLSEKGERMFISYPELHAAADSLASHIRAALVSLSLDVVQEEFIIPLLLPQSPELYISILAILKAGGAFCPLNLDAPEERIKFILNDVGAKVILVTSDMASKIPDAGSSYKLLLIDKLCEVTNHCFQPRSLVPLPNSKADNLAYVMYTSGSTGTPKGVGISHNAVTQSLLAHNRYIPTFQRFLQFAAPTFDVSVFEIFFPLFRGCTLVSCHRLKMLEDLPVILNTLEVDACELTPSVAGSLLKRRDNVPCLKLLLTIGEMLTEPVIREFGGNSSQEGILWGMYGPTEAAIHCTLQPAFQKLTSRNCIGVPLDTVSAFILDYPTEDQESVQFKILPLGEVGELAVGGFQLARGYFNRPEQTDAAFIESPWGRLYRTGDKARMCSDGTIECLGRINDTQVKLNGQRIELGEIEQAILRTRGCHSAFATVLSNVLVAFAAVENSEGMRGQILANCKSWLPTFMIPAEIQVMRSFPQLPSGKIDRNRLIADYEVSMSIDETLVPKAENDLEGRLCEAGRRLLGPLITPKTRLLSAGLDSLVAIEYASILRDSDILINTVDILDSSTIQDLSRTIQRRMAMQRRHTVAENTINKYIDMTEKKPSGSYSSLGPLLEKIERVDSCTTLQTSMIVETLKDHRLYVNQIELEFPHQATAAAIESWISLILQNNEILRTGFLHIDNSLHQVVWKEPEDQILKVDEFAPFNSYDIEKFLQRPLHVDIRNGRGMGESCRVRFTMHHAIYDGWTVDLLIEDMSVLSSGGKLADRPQYSLASKYITEVSDDQLMKAKEFWADYLRNSAGTSTPNFRTTTVWQPEIITNVSKIQLDPAEVKKRMFQSSFGPQVVFQACLGWLWATVTGNDEVILGSVFSGRTIPISGIEKMMGPLIATLPLRISLRGCQTITELLQSIHTANRESLRHEVLPLSEVKRAAGLHPNTRLFDILFVYQESLFSRKQSPSGIREVWHKDAVESSLLVEILPLEGHYSCQMTWHSDAYSHDQIRTFARHLDTLVTFFVQHLEDSLDTITECFPIESLSRYNEKPLCMDVHPSLSDLVEKTALNYPNHEALTFAQSMSTSSTKCETLTYHELNARANQIARHIQQHNIPPGEVIAIIMEKSILMYCGILGILKADCGYLPILPSTPINRINLILQQASPRLCLVDKSSFQLSTRFPCKIVNLEDASLSSYTDTNLGVHGNPAQLAYVIYTSGTTGTPKGVSVTNRNVLSNIEVLSRIYSHDPSARMLQACSQAFDVSVFEIFFAWGTGMCLCAATNDTLFEDLENAVRTLGVTHLSITVTVASLLDPRNVPNVKFLVTSGEPMTDEVLEKWASCLYQGYGPSETTNICTVRKVASGDSSQFLGWSFENTSTFVFYPGTLDLVPLGCVGELSFGGDQVTAGYLKLPEMTAENFFEHPEYGRLYRSGDLGRMLPDGSLIILGRIDTQVKLRGLRIELQEIQSIVLNTKRVRTCTSMLVTARNYNVQQLALFYVPVGHDVKTFRFLDLTDKIKHHGLIIHQALQDALPDYMVPSFILPVSRLPLTSSGKVDYSSLRTAIAELPDEYVSSCGSTYGQDHTEEEWTETEKMITKALVNTLHVDHDTITRWVPFAALGIDSISAMPLSRELQKIFEARVPLSLVIQNPSVGRLAAAITAKVNFTDHSGPSKEDDLIPMNLAEAARKRFVAGGKTVSTVLPCTPLQEAMLASSSSEESASYFNQMLFQLEIPSQPMIDYWTTMFQRHEILRTCFATTDDIKFPIVQAVLETYQPKCDIFESDNVSLQHEAARHSKSLSTIVDSGVPPVSLAIIRSNHLEYLSFVCHHAVYDGISIRNILSEIESLVHNEQLPTPLQFGTFLRESLSLPPDVNEFWGQHLQGFQPLHLERTATRLDMEPLELTAQASNRSLSVIDAQLKEMSVPLLSLCQTVWAVTISILQSNNDVCFGNVVSGRSVALDNIDTLVAPCFNTIPIRMNLDSSRSTLALVKKFQSLNIELLPYQFTGVRRIQSHLQLSSHLFDTLLILQPQSVPLDETIWTLKGDYGAMDVPIVCELTPSKEENTLKLKLHRHSSMFSHQTLMFILDIFQQIFDDCLDRPSSRFLTHLKVPLEWQSQINRLSPSPSGTDTPITTPVPSEIDVDWSNEEIIVRSMISKLATIPKERIERHMPIYRFGLDSIGAVQLSALLRREGHAISAPVIMANPTVGGIASCMKVKTEDGQISNYDFESFTQAVSQDIRSISGLPKDLEAVLPCSPVQQGMLSQFLMSEGKHYFNFSSWTLSADLDTDILLQSWGQLISGHQILRTGFIPINHPDSSFAMVVYPTDTHPIPIIKHEGLSFNIGQWRAESAQDALNKLYRPPWRVVLAEFGAGRSTMHLAMHHALYDAYSLQELLHDLSYLIAGKGVNERPSIQTDLSQVIKSVDSRNESETFWKSQAESLVVNSFPTLTPLRVDKQACSTVTSSCNMSANFLRQSAAEAGITLQAALQSAWTRLLSAYHGEATVTFGVVLDGRTTEESRCAVFPMISTLPVLAQNFQANQELLNSMLQYNASIRRHEHTPLPEIQRWLGRPDGALFDTILVYQVAKSENQNLPWTILDEAASVDYKVSLEIEEIFDKLIFNLTFDTSVLPTEQARILLQQVNAIFVDLVTHPNGSALGLVSEIPNLCSILPPAYRELPSSAGLLHQLVEQTAQQQPDALALEFVDELSDPINCRRWTYRELDEMGNKVANLLRHHHIPPRSIVAICFDKCPEAYFSILGILKAGCAFLALDPSAPSSRQEFILGDSKAACLLVAEGLRSKIDFTPPMSIHEVGINILTSVSGRFSDPPHEISPSDTCYCLYTSGTTGTPKGCLISHDNTVQAMLAFKELFSGHWDTESRWLQFASFHFDVSVLEQYWSWFVGITVVSAPRDLILSDLIKTISKLEITHIDLTPSLARLIHPDEVPSLCKGVFITGGEQLRQDVLNAWGPKEVIYNAYGPTEATIGVTMFQRVPKNGRSSNIGNLFANVGGYVFQPDTEIPVLRGAVGELCVSGRLVGTGYLNRPELTEEKFPTLKKYGERVYRTGDLVRVLHDGSIDFLGRADDQVKLRGQRLEIGEINHAIKAGVSQVADVATLVARHGGHDRDLLISFVTPSTTPSSLKDLHILSDQAALTTSKMAQDACRGHLPGYMVPTYVFSIPFIPLSANNKLQFNSLKQLFATLSQEELRNLTSDTTGKGRELNNRERQIADILSEITSVEISSIRPASTIFELGIDSITVTRVARGLLKAGFSSATPSAILKNPQISRMAQVLEQGKTSTVASRVLQVKQSIRAIHRKYLGLICRILGVSKANVEYIAPCTALQEGILTRTRTSGDNSAYFNQFSFALNPSVSSTRLREAWTRVIDSCPILRSSFIQTPGGYVQAALKSQIVLWTESHIVDDPIQSYIEARHRRWVKLNQDVLRYPIELEYIQDGKEYILTLRIFHAIYDAHSFSLILQKVVDEYEGASKPYGPSFLDVLPYGPILSHSSSRRFWETQFKNNVFQPMPKLTNEPSTSDIDISGVFKIDNLETRRIALGVTYQTILQASWLAALQQYFTAPPTIGVVFSGRSIVFDGAENVIGPMFNTLPFRVEPADMATWQSLIRKVHDYNTSVLDFVHTPLRDIQKWCSHGRQLFDTLFTFNHEYSDEDPGASLWCSIDSTAIADYPLALEVVLTRAGSLNATLVAQAGVADEGALYSLLDKFQQALESLATSNDDMMVPNSKEIDFPTTDSSTIPHNKTDTSLIESSAQEGGSSTFQWTDLARKLRREIAQLASLSEDEVSESISIFELGLDSIDAIKLAFRLSNTGVLVTTSELMKGASIENIIASLDTNQTRTGLNKANEELAKSISHLDTYLREKGVELEDVEAFLPPTPLQDSMVTDMVLSGFQRYFNHNVLEISPGADLDRLKCAWATVYDNSPILRTSFVEIDDPGIPTAFCQLVRKGKLQFGPTIELIHLEDVQTVIDQNRNRASEANASSDLFQVNFVSTPTSHYVVVSISHALYDGLSLDLLYRDVRAAYDGHYHAHKPYEHYLSQLLFSFGTTSHNFWADFMNDVHPTLLQSKGGTPEKTDPVVHRAEVMSKSSPNNIKTQCKKYGITLLVLSQGCWAAVLASLASSLDVTFGVVLSGRDTDDAQDLLFPTMNTIPMRIILHGTISEYLSSLQATMSEVLEFQHISLRQVQKLADIKGQNLFNTLFILQNRGEPGSEEHPLMKSVDGSSAVEYPICIEMELTNESVIWRIACDERFGSSDDAQRILDNLEAVLRFFVLNPDTEVVEFDSNTDEVRICGTDSFSLDEDSQFERDIAPDTPYDKNDAWAGVDSPIVDVLAQLSGVDKASINHNDTIYHLGLDSISAMKASSMLRSLGLRISVRDILKAPSIHQLVEHTPGPEEQAKETLNHADPVLEDINLSSLLSDADIDPSRVEKVLPALPMQVHMLTVWQNTNGLLFFPTFTYKLMGQISPDAVAKAWRILMIELPILRTNFVPTDSATTPIIQVIYRSSATSEAMTEKLEITDHGHWSFKAAFTPFVFLTIEGSKPGEAHIRLQMHHALYDGVSLPIIMDRFTKLCGTGSTTPPPIDAWNRFVSSHSSPDIRDKAKRFWSSYLAGAPPLNLLGDLYSSNVAQQVAMLKKDVFPDFDKLKRSSLTHGVTLQSLFFAAYAKVISTGRVDDVVFGIYMANRASFPGVEEAPFPTLSILPLRVRSPASKTINALATEIQEDLHAISVFENSTVGLWEIHQWTGLELDTFVNFLSLPENSTESNVLSLEEVPIDSSPVRVDVELLSHLTRPNSAWVSGNQVRNCYVNAVDVEVAVHGESMDIGVFSSPASYSEAQATNMVEQIVTVLDEI